jgi:hypothetical protein
MTDTEQTLVNTGENSELNAGSTLENEQTPQENAQADAEKPQETKTRASWTVKKPKVSDVEFIVSLQKPGQTISDALSSVVELAQKPPVTKEKALAEDQEIITIWEELYDYADSEDKTVEDTIKRLFSEKSVLENHVKQIESELNKKVDVPENAMVIEFASDVAAAIRLIRPEMANSNLIDFDKGNDKSYVNAIVMFALKRVFFVDFYKIYRRIWK